LTSSSYVLFSIGNVKPLFQATFPDCWKTFKICNKTWINAIDYLEVSGIIVGEWLLFLLISLQNKKNGIDW